MGTLCVSFRSSLDRPSLIFHSPPVPHLPLVLAYLFFTLFPPLSPSLLSDKPYSLVEFSLCHSLLEHQFIEISPPSSHPAGICHCQTLGHQFERIQDFRKKWLTRTIPLNIIVIRKKNINTEHILIGRIYTSNLCVYVSKVLNIFFLLSWF